MTQLTDIVGDLVAARAERLQRRLATPARTTRTAVVLGRVLAVGFAVCFLTGLYSHLLQDPLPGERFPTWPEGLYRLTQGVHVTVGIALIPLTLAKLWTVYPLLFDFPPIRSLLHALERASIALLVSSSLVQLATGLLNTYQWYPWTFPFRQVHFALGWVIVGSIALHVATKLPLIVRHWRRAPGGPDPTAARVGRRGFLAMVGAASAAVVAFTGGQSFGWLAGLDLFAPRVAGDGPQHLPINTTARSAGVRESATDPAWRLTVVAGTRQRAFSRADLEAIPQSVSRLPIACVEGWSTDATWRGVRLQDLLETVGAPGGRSVRVTSLEPHGAYRVMTMGPEFVESDRTLVALELNGSELTLDHGFPARIIAPDRPGVLQTKWLSRIEVL